MGFNVGEISAKIGADSTSFDKSLDQVKKSGEKASGDISKQFDKLSKKFTAVGKDLTKNLTLPLMAIGTAAFKMGKDFEFELTKVETLVGVAKDQVNEWGQDILQMAPALGRAPKELAEGLFFVTSAGIRGAEAMDVLEISAKAAAVGLGETKTIADTITSALNAYGMENLNAAKAADVLTMAVREGKLEASELAPVMGRLLPTAAGLNIEFGQVAGVLAVMSRTGSEAAESATSLNAIMTFLHKPTKQARELLDDVGISMGDLRGMASREPDGLVQVMRLLDGAFGDNDEALAQIIPNVRAFRGAMNLLAQDGATVDNILQSVSGATGVLDEAVAGASDTMQWKWNQTTAQFKVTLIEISEVIKELFIPLIQKLSEGFKNASNWLSNLDGNQKRTLATIAGIAIVIGPALLAISKMITVVKGLTLAFSFLAANPIVLALAGIAVGVGLIVTQVRKSEKELAEAINNRKQYYEEEKNTAIEAARQITISKKEAIQEELRELSIAKNEANLLLFDEIQIHKEAHEEMVFTAKKASEERIKALNEAKAVAQENYNNEIQAIREKYGVEKSGLKTQTDLVKESYAIQTEEVKKAYAEQTAEAKKAYDEKVALIKAEHAEKIAMIDESLAYEKSAIARELDLTIGSYEDQLASLDGATDEEIQKRKKARETKRAIELEELIVSATNAEEKQRLIEEREGLIQGIIAESADTQLETEKWKIRGMILEAMEEAKEKERIAEQSAQAVKDVRITAMEEELSELESNYLAQAKIEEDYYNQKLKSIESSRDSAIQAIQAVRIKAEENARLSYEAEKQGIDNRIKAEEEGLIEKLKLLDDELEEHTKMEHEKTAITLEEIAKREQAYKQTMVTIDREFEKQKQNMGELYDLMLEEEATFLRIQEDTKKWYEKMGVKNTAPFEQIEAVGNWLNKTFGGGDTGVGYVPGYALGTVNHPGGFAVVGERGPELLNLPAGSTVTPMDNVDMGGNSYFTITINQHNDSKETAEFANNDLIRKLQSRGLVGAQR